jgi:oligopeptide/dipeptide ABC transporter ATP-binding protein
MDPLLDVNGVVKAFETRDERGRRGRVIAVDGVSFAVERREILGLVGESGSGKTTLVRCLVRLVEPDSGTATFDHLDIFDAPASELRGIRRRMQLIYQDPYSSLNPTLTVGETIAEPARVHRLVKGKEQERALVSDLLMSVGLNPGDAKRRPRELSGGQRQRVAIARGLALEPELLIADEAVSALDVSVQAQILNLFADLAEKRQLTMILVSHQLAVIAQLAHRVAIMYLGRIVEIGSTVDVFKRPRHPYTAMLLAAHPDVANPHRSRVPVAQGELAGMGVAGVGCRFRDRCPMARALCAEADPPAVALKDGHLAWCHFATDESLGAE